MWGKRWWPGRRRVRAHESGDPPGLRQARHAREVSEAALDRARQRWPDITEIADRMREYSRINGISRLLDEALGGGEDDRDAR